MDDARELRAWARAVHGTRWRALVLLTFALVGAGTFSCAAIAYARPKRVAAKREMAQCTLVRVGFMNGATGFACNDHITPENGILWSTDDCHTETVWRGGEMFEEEQVCTEPPRAPATVWPR